MEKGKMADRIKQYRFQIPLRGIGRDVDEALGWVLDRISDGDKCVVDGEIVYQVLDEEEKEEQPTMEIAPDEWVAVLPER